MEKSSNISIMVKDTVLGLYNKFIEMNSNIKNNEGILCCIKFFCKSDGVCKNRKINKDLVLSKTICLNIVVLKSGLLFSAEVDVLNVNLVSDLYEPAPLHKFKNVCKDRHELGNKIISLTNQCINKTHSEAYKKTKDRFIKNPPEYNIDISFIPLDNPIFRLIRAEFINSSNGIELIDLKVLKDNYLKL